MDYSHAGYMGGGVALPVVPAAQTVMPSGGDDTASIQAALDATGEAPRTDVGFLTPARHGLSGVKACPV